MEKDTGSGGNAGIGILRRPWECSAGEESWQNGGLLGVNAVASTTENWGLGFGESGTQPTGNATPEELRKYNTYFIGNGDDKVIYLTFDCGYENGNTEKILEALKKHDVKATFFVVGHFLETSPDLVRKMVEEGHTVGNHTYHHPDMSEIADVSSFQKEVEDVKLLMKRLQTRRWLNFTGRLRGNTVNQI